MNSGDKAATLGFFCACVALVIIATLMAQCTMRGNELKLKQAQLELPIKMECLKKNKGVWVPRDNDTRPPYVCKFQ